MSSAAVREAEAARARPSAGDRRRVADWLTGFAVLLAYAGVQAALLQGPRPHDPALYFGFGSDFPDVDLDIFSLRIGLIAPIKAAVLAFGVSEAALFAVPFCAGLAIAAAVYATMLRVFGDRVLAAAAALVGVLNAYFLLDSSFLFPDPAATATFSAAVCLLVFAGLRGPDEEGVDGVRLACLVLAGLFLGWTYLIREFSLLLLPTVAAAFLLLRYRVRDVLVVVGGACVGFGLELLYGFLQFGDPLARLHSLLDRNDAAVPGVRLARIEHLQSQLDTPLHTLLVLPRVLVSWWVGWVFLLLVGVFLVALALRRDRLLWLFGIWFFGFWAIMAVLGLFELPSGRWILNVSNIRYWYVVLPGLVMGAFGGLALLVPRSLRLFGRLPVVHLAALALAALALVPGFAQYRDCSGTNAWKSDPLARWHELRSWLASSSADRYSVMWTDGTTLPYAAAYTRSTFGRKLWPGTVAGIGDVRDASGDVVVSPERLASSLILIHRENFPAARALRRLRSGWSPVFVSEDRVLVALAPTSIEAARVPEPGAWWVRRKEASASLIRTCRMQPYR